MIKGGGKSRSDVRNALLLLLLLLLLLMVFGLTGIFSRDNSGLGQVAQRSAKGEIFQFCWPDALPVT